MGSHIADVRFVAAGAFPDRSSAACAGPALQSTGLYYVVITGCL